MISESEAKKILRKLNHGIPPSWKHIDSVSVGLDGITGSLRKRIIENDTNFKSYFIWGHYGSGKSHLMSHLERIGMLNGFITFRILVHSSLELRMNKLSSLIANLLESFSYVHSSGAVLDFMSFLNIFSSDLEENPDKKKKLKNEYFASSFIRKIIMSFYIAKTKENDELLSLIRNILSNPGKSYNRRLSKFNRIYRKELESFGENRFNIRPIKDEYWNIIYDIFIFYRFIPELKGSILLLDEFEEIFNLNNRKLVLKGLNHIVKTTNLYHIFNVNLWTFITITPDFDNQLWSLEQRCLLEEDIIASRTINTVKEFIRIKTKELDRSSIIKVKKKLLGLVRLKDPEFDYSSRIKEEIDRLLENKAYPLSGEEIRSIIIDFIDIFQR